MEGNSRKVQPATLRGRTITSGINNSHYYCYYLPEINNLRNRHILPADDFSSNLQIVLWSLTIFSIPGGSTPYTTAAERYQVETEQSVLRSDNYSTSKQIFFCILPHFSGVIPQPYVRISRSRQVDQITLSREISKKSSPASLDLCFVSTALFC